jgi:hypothetical protein
MVGSTAIANMIHLKQTKYVIIKISNLVMIKNKMKLKTLKIWRKLMKKNQNKI